MASCEITLEQLLASRDRRRAMQMRLLEDAGGRALVVLTVVMPGSVKQTKTSAIVASEALVALEKVFEESIDTRLVRDLITGYELYMLVSLTPAQAKQKAMEVEEMHPLGRLMDIDVIGADGVPLSRPQQRRCLICGRPARECMRLRPHSLQQLIDCVNSIADEYILRP